MPLQVGLLFWCHLFETPPSGLSGMRTHGNSHSKDRVNQFKVQVKVEKGRKNCSGKVKWNLLLTFGGSVSGRCKVFVLRIGKF